MPTSMGGRSKSKWRIEYERKEREKTENFILAWFFLIVTLCLLWLGWRFVFDFVFNGF